MSNGGNNNTPAKSASQWAIDIGYLIGIAGVLLLQALQMWVTSNRAIDAKQDANKVIAKTEQVAEGQMKAVAKAEEAATKAEKVAEKVDVLHETTTSIAKKVDANSP